MAAIARETDGVLTGHLCTVNSTLLIGGQTGNTAKVYADGKGVSCLGDPVTPHIWDKVYSGGLPVCTPGVNMCPNPVTLTASATVYVDGKLVCRMGDAADSQGPGPVEPNVSVNGVITSGCGTVFAG